MGTWSEFVGRHGQNEEPEQSKDAQSDPKDRAFSEVRDKLHLHLASGYGTRAKEITDRLRRQRKARQDSGETGKRVIPGQQKQQ